MSHFLVVVLTKTGDGSEVERLLAPFEEAKGKNPKWDWWVIGGRCTGFLTGYEPAKDKRNYEKCWCCNGTGTRKDMDSSWCCNGNEAFPIIGKGCNGCSGTGWMIKHPPDWVQEGNRAKVADLSKDLVPFAILTPDGKWLEKGEMGWFASVANEKPDKEWEATVRSTLKKYKAMIAVAVDCHI